MKNQNRKLSAELQAIVDWEKENKIAALAIPLTDEYEDDNESYFGTCDISGEAGDVWDVEYLIYNADGSVNIDETYTATISHEALNYFYNGID